MWGYPTMYPFPPTSKGFKEYIDELKTMEDWIKEREKKDKKPNTPKGITFQWWEVGLILYALSKPMYLLLDHYHLMPLFQ